MTPLIPPLALLAFLAVACAGAGDDGPIEHPTGPDQVVLRVESGTVGLMHPMEVMNPGSPKLTLYGDGRLIVDEAEERSRFVTTFTVARLSEAGIQRLLDEAFEPGSWAVVWAAVRDPEQDGPWPRELVAEFRVRPWPLAPLAGLGEPLANVPTIRCTLVEGEDAERLSGDLEDDTFWESDGVVYYVYARPLLPDEDRCSDVA